jgi:hypothetical protein
VLPHYADGQGWTTEFILTNPSNVPLSGSLEFREPNGTISSTSGYVVPARSYFRLVTPNTGNLRVGSVRLVPSVGNGVPQALAIFSFRQNGVTVSEASVAAEPAGVAFRMYAESSQFIRTGLALSNPAGTSADVTLEMTAMDGAALTQPVSLTIPAGGQIARFIDELFTGLPAGFQGLVRITSAAPVAAVGLRGRYNERQDFLITTTPPWNEASPATNTEGFFPHIVRGGGYSTQLILLGPPTSGTFRIM